MARRKPNRNTAENKKRVRKIKEALAMGHYLPMCADSKTGWEAIVDALTDLRHLADEWALDIGEMDRVAHDHYLEEREQREDHASLS